MPTPPRKPLLAMVMTLVVVGCASRRPAIVGSDMAGMRDRALAAVPIGTSVAAARQIMEDQGFKCQELHDDSEDSLLCVYREQDGIWVTWAWGVEFQLADDKVSDAKCTRDGYGP